MKKKTHMGKGIVAFLIVSWALVLFAPTVQADVWTFDDAFGHHAKATLTIGVGMLTVVLENTADAPTPDPAHAVSGLYFDWFGPELTAVSATGDLYDYHTPSDVVSDDLRPGWGFRQGMPDGFFNFGIASAGLSSLDPWNINVPISGPGPLGGPDYLLVADFDSVGNGLLPSSDQPLTRGMATFEFSFIPDGPVSLGDRAVFTYGTEPDFVTPLPGAILLGFLGLGFAGMKLRKGC